MGRIQAVALALGPPGLALVAFLDSSFLSLPEIADLLVMVMVMQQKNHLLLYAASATAGSMMGCLVLYYVGLRGGSALVKRRFQSARVERTLAAFSRYGVMAVLLPSILPPPTPFKIFVLLAGVAEIGLGQFTAALAIGRGEHARLDAMLIDDLRPGTWVLAFRGAAVRTMSEDEAAQTNAALDALAAAMGGDVATVEASFRDLIDRKPQLPAHLQGGRS